MKSVMTRGLAAGSIFKLLFVGNLFSVGLLILIIAILSLFDVGNITVNNKPVEGVAGFFVGLAMIPTFSLIFAAVNWCFIALGQFLWTRFKTIEYRFKEAE